jgi:glycosyltransferase involved in cell wall biosynthesis
LLELVSRFNKICAAYGSAGSNAMMNGGFGARANNLLKASPMTRRASFFVEGVSAATLKRVEFYAQDIQILSDAGFAIDFVSSVSQLRPADLFFVWWWTWALAPIAYAKVLRRPVIVTGVLDVNYYHGRPAWHRAVMRRAFALADANVFTSQHEFSELPKMFSVCNARYVPLTVDESYQPGGARQAGLIGTVGWLQQPNATRKCLAEVIQAAALVHETYPEMRFVIAGAKGNYADEAVALAKKLGADAYVEFPGAISKEDKIRLMQECTVYLQPTRYEGFGLAILEAMSCGSPIVTSAEGAVPEVVADTAVMVDGASPRAIADGLLQYLGDPALRTRMGEVARERAVSKFQYSVRRDEMLALIEHLVH